MSRDVAIAFAHEPIFCPNDHKMPKDGWVIGDDAHHCQRCKQCGVIVCYWEPPPLSRILIQVNSNEAHNMERAKMSATQALVYLGLRWNKPYKSDS